MATSNSVLDETITLLGRWAGYDFAAARALLDSERLEVLRPGPQDERDAVELLAQYADRQVSFTDCVSLVLMRMRGIERVFSFDRHFRGGGSGCGRGGDGNFEVLCLARYYNHPSASRDPNSP